MSDSVLVIGGGIAGIQASLDLAEAGARVVMVERQATIGGIMAVLDKNFPTLDCSICIEAPKMSEVGLHPNIEVLSLSEVIALEGSPAYAGKVGDFQVRIRQQARYVTDACTRCGECSTACPVILPNEFDSGMASRKAIFTPIPQSVPGAYCIDIKNCLNQPPNYLPCNHCVQVCPPKAIDFSLPPHRELTRQVGSLILAAGYSMLDPRRISAYGYGNHPDILSALEFERLVNSAGPTGGEIIRPSNGAHPEKILFVMCVGSRDHRYFRHCSRFCCMYSIKHAYQAIDHGVKQVDILYMDVRAFGKGFDGFWQRTRHEGAHFLRGRPASIAPATDGAIEVIYENTGTGHRIQDHYEMVVLANAVSPPEGLADLARVLGIEMDEDGFIRSYETLGGLVATSRPGIYTAGCVSGPKDIPDSVAEGSGAAAMALAHLSERTWPTAPDVTPLSGIETPRIGVFVCHCGSNIAGVIDVKEVVAFARSLPAVVYASDQMFSCAGNTQQEIEEAIKREQITRVVVAACSPKTHESIFRGVLERAGLNPFLLEMSNIRNMDSWVHKHEKEAATQKAMDMVSMAVEKARRLTPLQVSHLPLTQSALVIGGGIAGMTAATALACQGFETHLVEKNSRLGGLLNKLGEIAPNSQLNAAELVLAKSRQVHECGVQVHLDTTIESISGVVGSFHASMNNGNGGFNLTAGAIVVATGSEPYHPTEFNYSHDPRVITNLELEAHLQTGGFSSRQVTFVSCIGSRQPSTEPGCSVMGCSRYCCTSMIAQAIKLRRMGASVRLLCKEVRTYSRQAEELYEQAMRLGVQIFLYDSDLPPQEAINFQDGYVEFFDLLTRVNLRIPTDLLVLVLGLRAAETNLAEQLKLARSEDGFFMELHPKLGPVQTAVEGVFLAGASQGAKDVRESMAQALAAAGKAGALMARGVIEKEPLTARLIPELCKGCMRCVKVCPFSAIEQVGQPGKDGTVLIHEAACMGCGTCAAECNFHAIEMPYFTREQILAQVDAALVDHPEGKCLVFTCNWCSYAGADLAGIEKRQYPPSARIIRTMCSARFEEEFISRAFERNAGAVLVSGCRLTETGSDCHYNYANRLTWKRFQHWQRKFERQGVAPERLQLRWISAAEGKEFAEKMAEMDEVIVKYQLEREATNV